MPSTVVGSEMQTRGTLGPSSRGSPHGLRELGGKAGFLGTLSQRALCHGRGHFLGFWGIAFQDHSPGPLEVVLDHHSGGRQGPARVFCGGRLRMGLAIFSLRFESA